MTDIEQKALALVNEVAADALIWVIDDVKGGVVWETLCLAIEQHEQFKREVSDAVEKHQANMYLKDTALDRFIIAKPDHIRGAALDIGVSWGPNDSESFRVALAKRGGRVVWENEP